MERVIKAIKAGKLLFTRMHGQRIHLPGSTPFEAAVTGFQKKLTVEGIKKSSVIEVSFRTRTPELAAQAVNLLVDFFKEKHLAVHSGTQSTFLEQSDRSV